MKPWVVFQITRQDAIAQCECVELEARWLKMELCEPLAVGRLPTCRSQVGEKEPEKSARRAWGEPEPPQCAVSWKPSTAFPK